jgi:hypothetical protein
VDGREQWPTFVRGQGRALMRVSRVDANQPSIVAALTAAGATVQYLHTLGQGCPDLLVGYRGNNYVLEVKDGDKPPSRRRLTKDEDRWHAWWRGRVDVVENEREALEVIGAVRVK